MANEQIDWEYLKKIYQFESSKVSGPGSYRRDINDVLWTVDELKSSISLSAEEIEKIEAIISYLSDNKQILKISSNQGPPRYITRIAETVRLLGHNYEYWYRGRSGIDSIRWLIADKKIPFREMTSNEFINELLKTINKKISNSNSTYNLRTAVREVVQGVSSYLSPKDWTKAKFSRFQLESTKEIIFSQFKSGHKTCAQILTAGVGSGKTLAFSMGFLISAVEGILSGESHRKCHLFLYPRKALAQDQFNKLNEIVKHIPIQQLNVHLEHYSFYSSENLTVKKGIEMKYGGFNPPPAIIITTLETLNRRLQHPLVIKKLSKFLSRVIIDEIHLVEGIPGCHVVRLLDRLRQSSSKELLWTGSSATVASPDLHAATVFGIKREDVKVIEPEIDNLITVGLVHHAFLRPTGATSFLGTLVNSTSILIHNRRDRLWDRNKNCPKSIGFADSLDLLGRWNSDFRENERTEKARDRKHPNTEIVENWTTRQREIPYALRFHNPLQRRIDAIAGRTPDPYEEVLLDYKGKKLCEKCKELNRIILKSGDNPLKLKKDEMIALGKLVYRHPTKSIDNVKAFHVKNDVFNSDSTELGTLDLCPFLRAGACFWFPEDDFLSEPIQSYSNPLHEWRSVVRSKIHSSKTEADVTIDQDLGEIVFEAQSAEVYDYPATGKLSIDIVFASPSLEVGVDLQNIKESIMFKAIRNVASYRQKVGRIGREINSDTINVSLLSLRPIDLHYYRQPQKLISKARLDPIPLKEHNDAILRCSLYMAVWDYLALECNLPEVVPISGPYEKETEFTARLRRSKIFIENNQRSIANYLSGVSRGKIKPFNSILAEIIEQVTKELDILLTPISGTIDDDRFQYVSDIIAHSLGSHSIRINAPKHSMFKDDIEDGNAVFGRYRTKINPILFDLSKEFTKLDCLKAAGWIDLDLLTGLIDSIELKVNQVESNSSLINKRDLRNIKKIVDALQEIQDGLLGMNESGQNPVVIYFYENFYKFKNDHPTWPYYLSYILQGMSIFKLLTKHPAYVRPPNLFTNPYEEKVTIFQNGNFEDSVPVSEAMYSFIPGTWTFRLGKTPKKTLTGSVDSCAGDVLVATLHGLNSQGNQFIKLKENVPAPLGFPSDALTIYLPTKLNVMNVRKYVNLDRNRRAIRDGDECAKRRNAQDNVNSDNELGPNERWDQIKIPNSYTKRWVHIISDLGTEILTNELDEKYLVIDGENKSRGNEVRKQIHHPLLNGIIKSVKWHEKLEVFDYVYGVLRNYSSRSVSNVTLTFKDPHGDAAFGRQFVSEGVSIELNPETVVSTVSTIKEQMIKCANQWAPSVLKAFNSCLRSIKLNDGNSASPFILRDLLGVLVTAISNDLDSRKINDLPNVLGNLLENIDDFRNFSVIYYKAKYLTEVNDEEDLLYNLSENDKADIEKQVSELINFALQLKDKIPDLESHLEHWLTNTLLNTFGLVALSALQKLCGSKDNTIGYMVDLNESKQKKFRVILYDRTPHGNGSNDVLKRYMHILNIQRHNKTNQSKLLPLEDFFTILEQELLQCPQFHTDMDALEKFYQQKTNSPSAGLAELGYVSEQSDEVLRVSKEVWNKLAISGREDAWKLPIIAFAPGSFAFLYELEIDDVIRATTICWNGCPECVINSEAIASLDSQDYVDKAVLDEWFKNGREKAQEYKTISVYDLALGKADNNIGRQSKVCLEFPDRKIRSISLPYTIGFELDRQKAVSHANLIFRDDDIHNLRLFTESKGSAHGIESLGFKRIMWYNLMTSAYLDILKLVPEARKEITFVFYDCRDVTFDEVGISSRMMEAIEYHRKKASIHNDVRSLSDILIWLARRGFKIKLCVDWNRSLELGVRDFLKKLVSPKLSNISISTKNLEGLMHKKALITPLGAIQGSANLTYHGTGLNEEIINYFPFGGQEYEEVKINIMDTFHGSKKWEKTNLT